MDMQQIIALRKRVPIPSAAAVRLLKEHAGDLDACAAAWHATQVQAICDATGCDKETAEESYEVCHQDLEKAIVRILARPIILTTRSEPGPKNEIGYVLWPENADGQPYKSISRNDAFIPAADFEWVIAAFRAAYPIPSRHGRGVETAFDVCGHNHFDRDTMQRITARILEAPAADPVVARFRVALVAWIQDKLTYADYLVVYGNL